LAKYDQFVQNLVEQIKPQYDSLSTNFIIVNKKHKAAEIGILARKASAYDIYEVKCSYKISKEKRQAQKISKYCCYKLNKACFCCGSSKVLQLFSQ